MSIADLTEADLNKADLSYANLRNAKLKNANLSNSNLYGISRTKVASCPVLLPTGWVCNSENYLEKF